MHYYRMQKGWPGMLGRAAQKIGGRGLRRVVIGTAKPIRNTMRGVKSSFAGAKTGLARKTKRAGLWAQSRFRPQQLNRRRRVRAKQFMGGYKFGRKAAKVAAYGAVGTGAYIAGKKIFGSRKRENDNLYRAQRSGNLRKVRRAGRSYSSHGRQAAQDDYLDRIDRRIAVERRAEDNLRVLGLEPQSEMYAKTKQAMMRRLMRMRTTKSTGVNNMNKGVMTRAKSVLSRVRTATKNRRMKQVPFWHKTNPRASRGKDYGRVAGPIIHGVRRHVKTNSKAYRIAGRGAALGVGVGYLATRYRGRRYRKLDGTGPEGRGPRTGRGLGWCPPEDGERRGRVAYGSGGRFYARRKLDGTGPEGRGPRTGRGLGWCPPEDGEGRADTARKAIRAVMGHYGRNKRVYNVAGVGTGAFALGRATKPARHKEVRTYSPYFIQRKGDASLKFKALKSSKPFDLLKGSKKITKKERIRRAIDILNNIRKQETHREIRTLGDFGRIIDAIGESSSKKTIIH